MAKKKKKVKKKCCLKHLKVGKHCKSCPLFVDELTRSKGKGAAKKKAEKKNKKKGKKGKKGKKTKKK